MTTNLLQYIKSCMNELDIPYEFMVWKSDLTFPFWIGEYIEVESIDEDGLEESTFILTGTSNTNYLDLMFAVDKIKDFFENKTAILENGSGVAFCFNTAQPIQTDVEDLYRIQINLTIKEWRI